MNHIVFLVNSAAASWMDALVRASWQGGLVIALVWLVCRLWPGMPPVPRCRLWRLAYAKLLLGLAWLPPLALPLLPHPSAPPLHVPAASPSEAAGSYRPVDVSPAAADTPTVPVPALPPFPTPAPLPSPHARPTLPTVQTWLLAA